MLTRIKNSLDLIASHLQKFQFEWNFNLLRGIRHTFHVPWYFLEYLFFKQVSKPSKKLIVPFLCQSCFTLLCFMDFEIAPPNFGAWLITAIAKQYLQYLVVQYSIQNITKALVLKNTFTVPSIESLSVSHQTTQVQFSIPRKS